MLTAEQVTTRRQYIGSSDAAAIMGCNPYNTVYDVWLDKMGKLDDKQQDTPAIDIGNLLEPALIDWCEKQVELRFDRNVHRVHSGGVLACTHDGLQANVAPEFGCEAKTTNILTPFFEKEDWGFDMTDQVPDHINIQCQHQMIVSGLRCVFVPALIGGRGLALFQVERNSDLCELILYRCTKFWNECILPGIPPGDSYPTLPVAKHIKKEPNKSTRLEYSTVKQWMDAKDELKIATRNKEVAEALLLAALGDAEAADTPIGKITHMEQTRAAFTTEPATFRVLRLKKCQKGV